MDSFFFNITDTSYKVTKILKKNDEHITRVDISNGIVFFDINLSSSSSQKFNVKNLDRMVVIPVIQKGGFSLHDNIANKTYDAKEDSICIFTSSRQDLTLSINDAKETKIFVLFIADFILKRYLSENNKEVINFLYNNIQDEISCQLINTQPIDALSLYIIDKIINTPDDTYMRSMRCEHNVLEFMIHRFNLLDLADDTLSDDEICISNSAKSILLSSFTSPPSIDLLAHLCATNESKLKKVFKKVYKTTIYGYIQKLRLEKANLLLKERKLNIGEIAKVVGYKHQGHFSNLFYEVYGVYPKDLLKK